MKRTLFWRCTGCKKLRKGLVCDTCLVKREDAEKAARAAAERKRGQA